MDQSHRVSSSRSCDLLSLYIDYTSSVRWCILLLVDLVWPTARDAQLAGLGLEGEHRRSEVKRVSLPDDDVAAPLQPEYLLYIGGDEPQSLVLGQARVLGRPRRLECKGLYPGITSRAFDIDVSDVLAVSLSVLKMTMDLPPSVFRAIPKNTPASLRTSAGLRLRGGPGNDSFLPQVSGLGRVAVRIRGTLASASSFANCNWRVLSG